MFYGWDWWLFLEFFGCCKKYKFLLHNIDYDPGSLTPLKSIGIIWDHLDHWRFRFRSNVMKCYLRYFYHVLAGLCTIRTAKRVVIRVVGSANRRRRCPAPNVYPQSNLYPICPPMCTHNMYPIHCTVCTLYSIFTSQPNKLRPTVKFVFRYIF